MKKALLLIPLLAVLAACGERPQEARGVRSDTASHAGTGVAVFTAPGWTPGDKTSWQNGLRARAQYGQNDYSPSRAN
ncbi:MAG: hypothetical protein Fur0019_09140 [Tibeticola sp.]